jgi:dipeptidyl aminopeptidase/acylaminoacyl peptidase
MNKAILKFSVFLFQILLILISYSVMGQEKEKKQLTIADYDLWSTVSISSVSDKGLWVSYQIKYESRLDTLVASSTYGKKRFIFPKGRNGKFCNENWFACMKVKNRLELMQLDSGKLEVFEGVHDYEFSENGYYLVVVFKDVKGKKSITIRNLVDGTSKTVDNVSCFRLNNDRSALAYCTATSESPELVFVSLKDDNKVLAQIPLPNKEPSNVVWNAQGTSVVLVLKSFDKEKNLSLASLAHYRLGDKKLFLLDSQKTAGFPKGKHIESNYSNDLCISKDGKRILFQIVPDTLINNKNEPTVEVWNGGDKRIYSERQVTGSLHDWSRTAVWNLDANTSFEFMDEDTHVVLSGNQRFALSSNLESCEPQLHYTADRDYHITDLNTREKTLWMSCYSGDPNDISMSPSGKFIAYFKDGNWFSYSFVSKKHKNLTDGMKISLSAVSIDSGSSPIAYGIAGWTDEDRDILLYDQFDLWQVALDGSKIKRLTKGRELETSYRVAENVGGSTKATFLSVAPSSTYNLKSTLLLQARGENYSDQGYCILYKGIVQKIVFGSHYITSFHKAASSDVYAYFQEDYSNAPSLQIKKGKSGMSKIIYQSNLQHENYNWGKLTVVSYTTSKGETLNGLLYYPSNYIKGKSYPMVVHVYERQMHLNSRYINPSIYLSDGFNVTNLVTRDYFVLLPNISYVIGKPGDSALDCVSSAVSAVLELGDVNAKKIGLIGHSFGGYETSYIFSKSKIFCTAIAGAAQTNYVSGYLDISANYKKAEFWRYEFYSNRMGKPLFESLDNYIYNSPVFNADKIEGPLLLWTGTKDTQVSPAQSMELYLALRRLRKKVVMLRYPNENHGIYDSVKQADLTQKVNDWFDFYLKNKPRAGWMTADTNP